MLLLLLGYSNVTVEFVLLFDIRYCKYDIFGNCNIGENGKFNIVNDIDNVDN